MMRHAVILLGIGLVAVIIGCAKKEEIQVVVKNCAPTNAEGNGNESGSAFIFNPDPASQWGNLNLKPNSQNLDTFKIEASLKNLNGKGILSGRFVEVRNGSDCGGGFGAYDLSHQFRYGYSDRRFQEAMSYYFGDNFQVALAGASVLKAKPPIKIIAHCMDQDNAYYARTQNFGGAVKEFVCLGDSLATRGASYSDDAMVLVHELQHSMTADAYSDFYEMQGFRYDEGGALSEGISDFTALAFFEPSVTAPLDPRVFSRWALGLFIPQLNQMRGAHLCPIYDSDFPNCRNFRSNAGGFSADQTTVSFIYPDGLGWPYAQNFSGPGLVQAAFLFNPGGGNSKEEIHGTATIIVGALWDVFKVLSKEWGGSSAESFLRMLKLITKAVEILPKPNLNNLSPVHFRNFSESLVRAAQLLQWSTPEQEGIKAALEYRGLLGVDSSIQAGWAQVGEGSAANPGMQIRDDPTYLKSWVRKMGADPRVISQGIETGMNGVADSGEVLAIWFDIENQSEKTAGQVTLQVNSQDSSVSFLDGQYNFGYLNSQSVQMIYGKINGIQIVKALDSADPLKKVGTGNSYFKTNPFYSNHWQTALWIKVKPETPSGSIAKFQIELIPSNGANQQASEILNFQLRIH